MSKPKQWTKGKVRHALRAWKKEYGSYPCRKDWYLSGGDVHPQDKTVLSLFETWEEALRSADTYRFQRPHPGKAEIIAFMNAWEEEHGVAPVAADWNNDWRYPTPSWVKEQFGSWNAAIVAAGYFPRARGITKKALARYTPLPRRRKEEHADQGSREEASGDEGVA